MDDLGDVYTKLYKACAKWFDIGLALNCNFDTLKYIESEQQDNSARLREMLARRIQSGGPLTWNDLCRCLENPTVGRTDIAKEINPGLLWVKFTCSQVQWLCRKPYLRIFICIYH